MTTYPVYDVSRHDFTGDCQPIGTASNETEALALLSAYYAGTGSGAPSTVELNDRDVGTDHLWAYWPVWEG